MFDHADLIAKLQTHHLNDRNQLEAITSPARRLLIEAPAGYGKTKTMVSKIAYMLATNLIPYPKRLLALTFSVNAAQKIKKDIAEQIPVLLNSRQLSPAQLNERIFATNYHGFCRHILKRYGYLLNPKLAEIDSLKSVSDDKPAELSNLNIGLSSQEISLISGLNDAVKNKDFSNNYPAYGDIILNKLIPNGYITYNAIITLTIRLFQRYPEIRAFYQEYFPTIIVDEFQDTNILGYSLIKHLVTDKTRLIVLGDPRQRIYGFIGAISNLLTEAQTTFSMDRICLTENYRFKNTPQMLVLDANLRKIAENPETPDITEMAMIEFTQHPDQTAETNWIISHIQQLHQNNPQSTVAILVKQRGRNTDVILAALSLSGLPYFYGLFSDDDEEYRQFHRECLRIFKPFTDSSSVITKNALKKFIRDVKTAYKDQETPTINSLIVLLEAFCANIRQDYPFLDDEEKFTLIIDTLESLSLKQSMKYIKANLVISTIHAAKGLEWDFVILPDMEQGYHPHKWGLCKYCNSHSSNNDECLLQITSPKMKDEFLDDINVFYVAVTRARSQVYFSASKTMINEDKNQPPSEIPCNSSCFLRLPGIQYTLNI